MPDDSSRPKRSRSPELDTKANKRLHLSSDTKTASPSSSSHPAPPGPSTENILTSTTNNNMSDATSTAVESETAAAPTNAEETTPPAVTPAIPPANIHMRCLIVTQDASIIIGKAGAHVNEIRDKSGARVMVSESIPGNPERILNVSGALDAVSKAFGLIVRRINDEPFDAASIPGSRAVTIKFIIPNSRMGSVIGKGGSKIKEIQEASGAKLNASEGMLPGSTERVLSVSGVADAIHIATYYVGNILIEAGAIPASQQNSSYRPSAHSRGPRSAGGGSYGGGDRDRDRDRERPRDDRGYHHASSSNSSAPYGSNKMTSPALGLANGSGMLPASSSEPQQTQQIYIPNDLVGCIIGKGGSKINEIRQMSASTIRIMEQSDNVPPTGNSAAGASGERLVVITGGPQNVAMAVQLLYQRLESERLRIQNKTTT